MATTTPRRSLRVPHTHTPKMSERKKGLFLPEAQDSLTKHRQLAVLDSESESDDCDLGIMGALDSSSCDENDSNHPKTPEKTVWHTTRSQSRKLLKESQDLKNFIKSPFTLTKYQTRYSCSDKGGSNSTPVTPHFRYHPGTPSSTHSCNSIHTTSSTSSRARKSLVNLIADTESCSSSLKDLTFDTDSSTDAKENTPSKSVCKSRRGKLTPKLSFKGVLSEQKKNVTPLKTAVVCLTKMDMNNLISPSQLHKTPHNISETNLSPPKLCHNRRSVHIEESPESPQTNKRYHKDTMSEGPVPKHPRLEMVPKARVSLFNSDRLKEILSAKSFYGKPNPDINRNVAVKISNAIEVTHTHRRRLFPSSHNRRKRRPGQINLGVQHKIRKPKPNKVKVVGIGNTRDKINTSANDASMVSQNSSMASQNTSQELDAEKADPFDKEKQTIDALLSQWTEEDVPETELHPRQDLPCFNDTIIEETSQIFQPVTAVPVHVKNLMVDSEAVLTEIGGKEPTNQIALVPNYGMETEHQAEHGTMSGEFLPVEGGYIVVDNAGPVQEVLPDLDELERELQQLDDQILKMARTNNMNAEAVIACTEATVLPSSPSPGQKLTTEPKLFSIFSNPNPGSGTPTTKGQSEKSKLRGLGSQYVIDAGQKKFGATQCKECGVIYEIGNPEDEHDHLVHHNASDVLKYNPSKNEVEVGSSGTFRCVRIRGGDTGWRKVEAVLARVVHPQLGFDAALPGKDVRMYTAYLYLDKRQIVGCLVVEGRSKAYRFIPGDPDCCSLEEYPVKMGICRIWTHTSYRRRGVAARLIDCARASFLHGAALRKDQVAFSAPTGLGKLLATKYCGTEHFYVYLD